MADESGSTEFLVDTYTDTGNEQFIVDTDGRVSPFEPDRSQFDTFDFYGGLRSRSGDTIVNDAGGVYSIGADDAVERLSTGQALASNDGFVLLRECDAALDCGYVVLDRTTGERRPSPATTEQLGRSYGFDLARDGTATLAYDYDRQERRLVDLVDGTVVAEVGISFGPDRNTQWAADSSGVFSVNPNGTGLSFIDRVSGESVEFGDELGRITGLGVRMPDAELGPAGTGERSTDPLERRQFGSGVPERRRGAGRRTLHATVTPAARARRGAFDHSGRSDLRR